MRKQIAAANWKMNLKLDEATSLLNEMASYDVSLANNQQVIVAVPYPYLLLAEEKFSGLNDFYPAAQNIYTETHGAYTGEVSAPIISSLGIRYALVGHSERREYFSEDAAALAKKVNLCLGNGIKPIFCCGEALDTREQEQHKDFVAEQIQESLFHLSAEKLTGFVVAYEPIWAIGTGKTAFADQAQEMHAHIREVFSNKYGRDLAESISILYGGSVKGDNAAEIFSKPDVDGGLVGGASLKAADFLQIIKSLK